MALDSRSIPAAMLRDDAILTHPVFNRYHSETEMMRYMRALERKDLALNQAMIPLGSCTMKLNAAAEMIPITAGICRAAPVLPGRAGGRLSSDDRPAFRLAGETDRL